MSNKDEFSKKELYDIIKLLGLKPVSKATKPMLVAMINDFIDHIHSEVGIGASVEDSPMVDPSVEAEPSEPDEVSTDEGMVVIPEIKDPKETFRGFHPITGEPL